jgi:hypothetical protein
VTRNMVGETLDQALNEGSNFYHVLKEINPELQYAALLVDASSFEAFRTLRQVLREQNIPFGWEPISKTVFRFSAEGQLIGEEI